MTFGGWHRRDEDLEQSCGGPELAPSEDDEGEELEAFDDDEDQAGAFDADGLDEEGALDRDDVDSDDASDEGFPFPSPRILVVDARAKARGVFFGRWVDAAVSEEELAAEIEDVLRESPYGGTKWQVDKQEGFGRLELGPHPAIGDVATLAANIAEHGPVFVELVAKLGGIPAIQYAARVVEEDFEGSFASRGAWARERTAADGLNPRGAWAKHVDWDALTREHEKKKDIFVIEEAGRFYVFRE